MSENDMSEVSDGYHTFGELYRFRMLYHAVACRHWIKKGYTVVRSPVHSDGQPCFGGGWFVVVAVLPTGQITNHYSDEHWGTFSGIPVALPPPYDGHTSEDVADRIERHLKEAADE